MNCNEAKEHIRNGRPELARAHIACCADCRAFEEIFSLDAAILSRAFAPPPAPDLLLKRAIALASAELANSATKPSHIGAYRYGLAAIFAALFAPVLIYINYCIASTGDAFLTKWLSPFAGNFFFGGYVLGAAAVTGIAYGALPLIAAAVKGAGPHHTLPNGGATA